MLTLLKLANAFVVSTISLQTLCPKLVISRMSLSQLVAFLAQMPRPGLTLGLYGNVVAYNGELLIHMQCHLNSLWATDIVAPNTITSITQSCLELWILKSMMKFEY